MAVIKYGKHKAVVVNINDPHKSGRIQVYCPSIYGRNSSPWCTPCVPVAGDNFGDFCLPKLEEAVWIEFENGDINKPIYTGGWYDPDSAPIDDYEEAADQRVISFGNVRITFKDGVLQFKVEDKVMNLDPELLERLANFNSEFPSDNTYFVVQEEDNP